MGFGFGEKVLVIMHGLPVLDHRVHLLVVLVLCVGHRYLLTTRGAFGGCDIRPPNAPHILRYMSIAIWKYIKIFFRSLEERIKQRNRKRAEIWALKSFRDRSHSSMEGHHISSIATILQMIKTLNRLNRLTICVRMFRIKYFICPHHCYKVFSFR